MPDLPIEIINKILMFRQVHPVAKIVRYSIDDHLRSTKNYKRPAITDMPEFLLSMWGHMILLDLKITQRKLNLI